MSPFADIYIPVIIALLIVAGLVVYLRNDPRDPALDEHQGASEVYADELLAMHADMVVERVARYLCADYWSGDDERWDEWTDRARDVIRLATGSEAAA